MNTFILSFYLRNNIQTKREQTSKMFHLRHGCDQTSTKIDKSHLRFHTYVPAGHALPNSPVTASRASFWKSSTARTSLA